MRRDWQHWREVAWVATQGLMLAVFIALTLWASANLFEECVRVHPWWYCVVRR